jgi:pyruvate dehydrogenase E2 component (dihydrolipoamide acetyltransferase)
MNSEDTERFEFRLPDPGEGLTEAELVGWTVSEGQEIREDDALCEVETDKAVVEIPAPCTGTILELRTDPGAVIEVGEVIAVFETENPPGQQEVGVGAGARDSAPGEPGQDSAPDDVTEPVEDRPDPASESLVSDEGTPADLEGADAPPSSTPADRRFAAPSTRRYAREHGIDLDEIEGTGPGGRVLRNDIDCRIATTETSDESPDKAAVDLSDSPRAVRESLTGVRRSIAENMQRSVKEIPHVTTAFEADAGELVALKRRLNEKYDQRVTYTAILLKAVLPALQAHPMVNASIDMDAGEIVKHQEYNIGVATHTDDGLLVPVINDVDNKSILEAAAALETQTAAARTRSLDPADMQGGTFTMTNMGTQGADATFGTPIIRHPEAAILGVGAITDGVVAVRGEPQVRDRISFSFSYDHRLIDGVTAADFMETVVETIEDVDAFLARI